MSWLVGNLGPFAQSTCHCSLLLASLSWLLDKRRVVARQFAQSMENYSLRLVSLPWFMDHGNALASPMDHLRFFVLAPSTGQLRAKHGPLITPPWPSALAQRERSLFACCVEAARQPNHLGTGPHTTSSHAIYLLGWNASICDPVPKECATDHSSFALCAGSLAPCAQSLCTPVACHVNRQLFAVQPSEVDSM